MITQKKVLKKIKYKKIFLMKNRATENSHFYDEFFVALFFILKNFCNLFRLYEYFIITLGIIKKITSQYDSLFRVIQRLHVHLMVYYKVTILSSPRLRKIYIAFWTCYFLSYALNVGKFLEEIFKWKIIKLQK